MQYRLLQTKLTVPRLRTIVRRERLRAKMLQCHESRLTLVCAPAGFGKTTLVSGWAAECPCRLAWVSLDAGDNDVSRFFSYVAAAFARTSERLANVQADEPAAPGQVPFEALLTDLINAVAAHDTCIALVLDDYHLITSEPVHRAVAFLLENQPPQLRIVIVTRVDPPLPVARLRASGELTEIRSGDLRFTEDEAAEFFREAMNIGIDARLAEALARHAEGWAAGLQMAAVSLRGVEDPESFVMDFAGTNRYVLDYLIDEVLSSQDERLREFLQKTAIMDRLNAQVSEAVTGFQDSQALLEQAERANLFIVPLDEDRHWFRYHHLFAELLRQGVRSAYPDELPELHRRAATWFQAHDDMDAAAHHFLEAGDHQQCADLLETVLDEALLRGEYTTLLRWFEALSDAALDRHPRLRVYFAVLLLVSARPVRDVERQIDSAGSPPSACDPDGSVPLGELEAFRAVSAAMQGNAEKCDFHAARALSALPEAALFFRLLVSRAQCITRYLATGEVNPVIEALLNTLEAHSDVRNTSGEVVLLSEAAELSIVAGKLNRSYELYLRALAAGPSLAIAGIALEGLGEVEREWNRLDEAEVHVREGLRRTRGWGTVVSLDGLLTLARIQLARGEPDEARETLEEARLRAASFDVTDLDDALVAAHRARLAIAVGDLTATERWVDEWSASAPTGVRRQGGGVSGTLPQVYHIWELECITMARLHLARGEYEEALADLGPLAEEAAAKGRYGSVVELEMLRAVAYDGLGQEQLAVAAMIRSLSLGENEGYMRVYLDEGPTVARLVYRAASDGVCAEYAGRILAGFSSADVASAIRRAPGVPPAESDRVVEPLSDRELQVLRLLSRGLSNKEIAAELYVSVRTVKFHTSNIYERLSAKNRTEAVAKARALGIISDQRIDD